jgi:serine protease Do
VREANELPLLAGDAGVDAAVVVALVREKKPMTLKLTLGSHPDNARIGKKLEPPSAELPKKAPDPSIGISVLSLDGDDRVRLDLPKDLKGARITKVRPGSVAFFAGVSPDDVVTSVNGKSVGTGEEFAAVVRATPSGELLKLMLRRGASTIFSVMKKP